MRGCCEFGNETSGFVKCEGGWGEFLDQLRTCQTLKNNSAAWSSCIKLLFATLFPGTAIAQSVLRLATEWTVWGSNPGGGRVFPHSSRRSVGPTQPPIQQVPGLIPGVKQPGRGVNHPPHLAPRLKKEYSYTSTRPLGLCGLLQGESYFYLYLYFIYVGL